MTDESKVTKMQVTIDKEIYERFKTVATQKKVSIPGLVETMMLDYVEEAEDEWLDMVYAKRLDDAHAGKKRRELVNVKQYYKEVLAKEEKEE